MPDILCDGMKAFSTVFFMCHICLAFQAQNTATIAGVITDLNDEPLRDVIVLLEGVNKGDAYKIGFTFEVNALWVVGHMS